MSMPQIPENPNRPSHDETIIDLLESVALEHVAISHIINAEGERLQELINKYACEEIDFCQLECSCQGTNSLLNSLIMKEWLLQNRLNTIMDLNEKINTRPSSCFSNYSGESSSKSHT